MAPFGRPVMKKDGVMRRPLKWLEPRKPGLHRWLTTDAKPTPALREAAGGLLVILLLVGLLWGVTGQPIGRSPVVVIESGSMMHCDEGRIGASVGCSGPFGRLGTIDPGDLIFVHDVDRRSDVQTRAGCLEHDGKTHHGACGDTIIFLKDGTRQSTPIIHRALLWLEFEGNGRFGIPECGIAGASMDELLLDPCYLAAVPDEVHGKIDSALRTYDSHPYNNWGAEHSGFITLGDNNGGPDQFSSIQTSGEPIRAEWILGKARGELPWLGLLKLWVTDLTNDCRDAPVPCNFSNAPADTKVLMWLSLGVLVLAPIAIERVVRRFEEQPR